MSHVGWLDCSSGVSGDMLLGALAALDAVDVGQLPTRLHVDASVSASQVTRHGLAATQVTVTAVGDQPPRRLADIVDLLSAADVPAPVGARAQAIFRRLAGAEATVHGSHIENVHFHEVGAVDALVDVVGACLGLHALGLDLLIASSIALGSGRVAAAHGSLPVPAPAVLELLAGTPLLASGGPHDVELATPTGVAVLAEWSTGSGLAPTMTIEGVGVGAGGQDLPGHPNVLRLILGTCDQSPSELRLVEANVDDLDPRLWPGVLDRLLLAGAVDAWLTPILMKKGRPAHTVAALVSPAALATVRDVLVEETTTIGIRETVVSKRGLDRRWLTVNVAGVPVRIKVAGTGGRTLNVAPEFDDVAAAAVTLGRPVKEVLARASAAALTELEAQRHETPR